VDDACRSPGRFGEDVERSPLAFFDSPNRVASALRKRVAALPDAHVQEQIWTPTERGRFTEDGPYAGMAFMGQHDSARLHEAVGEAVAHEGATYCEIPRAPIMFPPVKKVEVTTISPATAQAGVDKTCAKILSECETVLRCTIIVECLAPCTDGRFRLFCTKQHSRFEDDNAAEQMRVRDALDARIRLHPLYRSVFKTLFRSKAKEQLKAMQLQDTITLEVSDKERLEADKKGFSVKALVRILRTGAPTTRVTCLQMHLLSQAQSYMCEASSTMACWALHASTPTPKAKPS